MQTLKKIQVLLTIEADVVDLSHISAFEEQLGDTIVRNLPDSLTQAEEVGVTAKLIGVTDV